MGSRIDLHMELKRFSSNVYFQPPSNIQLVYPCIIYTKSDKHKEHANNGIYKNMQGYQVMVIDKNPESTIADNIEVYFQYCEISRYYIVDNLNHTTLNLYY